MRLFIFGTLGRMCQSIRDSARNYTAIEILERPEPKSVLIDFTAPAALSKHLEIALSCQASYLVGTTSLSQEQMNQLQQASEKIPILQAPNTSLEANLLIKLTQICSEILKDYDLQIRDIHHQHKKDAPSGTALALKKASRRHCEINSERIGEVIGIHEVSFKNENEILSLRHEVFDRKVFAEGAIQAAFFLAQQAPGLYNMKDVLGLPK